MKYGNAMKLKKTLLLTVVLNLLLLFPVQGTEDLRNLFVQANQAYRANQYQKAVAIYKRILSRGFESKELYYNLGNCYYRLNEIGEAILYYEKARKLDPGDPDVKYNLDIANLRVVDQVKLPRRFVLFEWWDALKWHYSIFQLRNLVFSLYFLTVGLLIAWLFVRRHRIRQTLLTLGVLLGILTIFWSYIFYLRISEVKNHREGVILTSSVTVLSEPEENSTDMFILHEGTKVFLDEQRGEWMKIRLPDGNSGWIPAGVIGII